MFSNIIETLTKLLPSPFSIVKAEDELIDPAKVLKVYQGIYFKIVDF